MAYQILVASSSELLSRNQGDLWDSGKVDSDQSIHVDYAGKNLGSGQACFGRCGFGERRSGLEMERARAMEHGLVERDDWKGQWIEMRLPADDRQRKLPLPRRCCGKLSGQQTRRRATVYLCGLGYHELNLNGAKVGDHVLSPMITQHDKRLPTSRMTSPNSWLKEMNAVGVELKQLGTTRPSARLGILTARRRRAQPQLLLQLNIEFADGSKQEVVSNPTGRFPRPIQFDQTRIGEFYDARLRRRVGRRRLYDDSTWGRWHCGKRPREC